MNSHPLMDNDEKIDALLKQAYTLTASDTVAALDLALRARQLADACGDQAGQANSYLISGMCRNRRAELQLAVGDLSQALALFQGMQNRAGEAQALNELGNCWGNQGDDTRAFNCLQESLAIWQTLDQPAGLALCLNNLGNRYYYFGQFDQALDHYQQSLAIRERIGDLTGMAQCYNNLAIIDDKFSNYDRALEYYQKSLDICQEQGYTLDAANTLLNMGGLLHECLNQSDQARQTYLRALELVGGSNKMLESLLRQGLGNVALSQQQFEQAQAYLDAGVALLEGIGGYEVLPEVLIDSGRCQLARGDLDAALASMQRALDLARQNSANETAFLAHQALADAYEKKGDFDSALCHFKEFHRLREEVFNSQTALKVKGVLLQAEAEKARSEAEIYRLKHEELSKAHHDLQNALDENQKLVQELQLKTEDLLRQVFLDDLTGLHNRRSLEERLASETERAQRLQHDLVVALIEIDGMKTINDRLSAVVGDQVLKVMGQLLQSSTRPVDVVGRYAGGVFMLLLLENDLEQGIALCKTLFEVTGSYNWRAIHPVLRVNIRAGLSSLKTKSASFSLFEMVDSNLMQARRLSKELVADLH